MTPAVLAPKDPTSVRSRLDRGQRRGLRWWQNLIIGLVVLALLGAGAAASMGAYYTSNVDRRHLTEDTGKVNWGAGPLDVLVFGADSKLDKPSTDDGRTADTIMLVHFDRGLDDAVVTSLPRASYVDVPASGDWKGGKTTLDRALVIGGPLLVSRTVSKLTGVELDGAIIVDLHGVRQIVDAVGGVDLCIPKDEQLANGIQRTKGCRDVDGAEAEEFMRERPQSSASDSARIRDQQLVVKALIEKAATAGILANPIKVAGLLNSASKALVVDEGLDLSKFALSLRQIKPDKIRYATVPVTKGGAPAGAVRLDPLLAPQMFTAIKDDKINDFLDRHKSATAPK